MLSGYVLQSTGQFLPAVHNQVLGETLTATAGELSEVDPFGAICSPAGLGNMLAPGLSLAGLEVSLTAVNYSGALGTSEQRPDVLIAALRAGFNMDGDVDFNDFSILAGNFTGTLEPGIGGFGLEECDTDGDEDVDVADFCMLAGECTCIITGPASDTPEAEGDVHLDINVDTDTMTLQPHNANLAGYSIRSSDSQIVPGTDSLAAPFLFYLLNALHEVTAGSVGATTMLTGDLVLDISFAGDKDQAENVVFQYTRAGEVTPVDGVVHLVPSPEPATMILLAAGGLLVMLRGRHYPGRPQHLGNHDKPGQPHSHQPTFRLTSWLARQEEPRWRRCGLLPDFQMLFSGVTGAPQQSDSQRPLSVPPAA